MNPWAWAGIALVVGAVTYWRTRPPGWPIFGERTPYHFNIGKYWDGETMKSVDAALFNCTRGSQADALVGLSPQRKLEEVQTCMARQVFPEVPWPPVSGDHDSVHLNWHKIGMVAERELEGVDVEGVDVEDIPAQTIPTNEEADWDEWDEDEDEDGDQDPGTIPAEGPGDFREEGS